MTHIALDGHPNIFLRRLQPSDIADIQILIADGFGSSSLGEEVAERLAIHCENGLAHLTLEQQCREAHPAEYWVAVQTELAEAHSVIGMGGLYRAYWVWEKSVWLGWFAVSPRFQGKRIGAAMLTALMRLARTKGNEVIKVETGRGGRATEFYKKSGFVEEAVITKYYSKNLDCLILSRDLMDMEPL